jgi:hypothetical protein
MTKRNMLYVTKPFKPLGATAADSAFTHFVLGSCHVEQNPAMQRFRILDGPASIGTVFGSFDFSQWIGALQDGTFPPSLRQASAAGFENAGKPLSDNVTVAPTGSSGFDWILTDNANANVFPMQVDVQGTFVSFNGHPLLTITGPSHTQYVPDLDNGVVPAGMLAAAGLTGPTSNYTITQEPPQTMGPMKGLPQWLLTDTTNGFIWLVGIGIQSTPEAFAVHASRAFLTENMAQFLASLDPVTSAGKPVYMSLGGARNWNTWVIMGNSMPETLITIAEILQTFSLSGVDYDFEQSPGATSLATMTEFTQQLLEKMPGVTVSVCPFIGGPVGELYNVWTNVGLGPAGIAWGNCQNYNPGNNPPSSFTGAFVQPLMATFHLSQADAASFLNAGFENKNVSVDAFAGLIRQVVQDSPTLGGAFTYNRENITVPLSTWANAVADALGATG